MPLEPYQISSKLSAVNEAGIFADRSAMLDVQVSVREGLGGRAGQERETGGLLLGSGGSEVRIEAIRPVPIEYRFGPSFWLGSADVERWKQAIAQAAEAGRMVVGHYRSQRIGGSGSSEPEVQ